MRKELRYMLCLLIGLLLMAGCSADSTNGFNPGPSRGIRLVSAPGAPQFSAAEEADAELIALATAYSSDAIFFSDLRKYEFPHGRAQDKLQLQTGTQLDLEGSGNTLTVDYDSGMDYRLNVTPATGQAQVTYLLKSSDPRLSGLQLKAVFDAAAAQREVDQLFAQPLAAGGPDGVLEGSEPLPLHWTLSGNFAGQPFELRFDQVYSISSMFG